MVIVTLLIKSTKLYIPMKTFISTTVMSVYEGDGLSNAISSVAIHLHNLMLPYLVP